MLRRSALRAGVREVASFGLLLGLAFLLMSRYLPEAPSSHARSVPAGQSGTVQVCISREEGIRTGSAAAILMGEGREAGAAPWEGWVWLEGSRLETRCDSEDLRVVAVRIPHGVAVGLYNPEDAPVAVSLRPTLPPGLYTVDRLVYGAGVRRVERLQACRSGADKRGMLLPASGAVYRFVNHASRASEAYRRAMQRIARLQVSYRPQAARLASSLRECPWNLTMAGSLMARSNGTSALDHIHRALLTVHHAEALCANAIGLKRIPRSEGEAIAEELAGLEEALVEASAACLGLVANATQQRDLNDSPGVYRVLVTVRNAGTASVSAVRLWATGDERCAVEPADAAVFASLRPGQGASAEFRVRTSSEEAVATLAGHLAYVRKNSPAHLRLPCN